MGVLVEGHMNLVGSVPKRIYDSFEEAIKSVPCSIWRDENGDPLKKEVREFDRILAANLGGQNGGVSENYRVIDEAKFHCDIAIPKQKVLAEIEKGKQPRLELDLIKLFAAHHSDSNWKYGLLIVPTNYVELRLAGRKDPYKHLSNLARLAEFAFHTNSMSIGAIGYVDPRGDHPSS
jgi:hypothetical protein